MSDLQDRIHSTNLDADYLRDTVHADLSQRPASVEQLLASLETDVELDTVMDDIHEVLVQMNEEQKERSKKDFKWKLLTLIFAGLAAIVPLLIFVIPPLVDM